MAAFLMVLFMLICLGTTTAPTSEITLGGDSFFKSSIRKNFVRAINEQIPTIDQIHTLQYKNCFTTTDVPYSENKIGSLGSTDLTGSCRRKKFDVKPLPWSIKGSKRSLEDWDPRVGCRGLKGEMGLVEPRKYNERHRPKGSTYWSVTILKGAKDEHHFTDTKTHKGDTGYNDLKGYYGQKRQVGTSRHTKGCNWVSHLKGSAGLKGEQGKNKQRIYDGSGGLSNDKGDRGIKGASRNKGEVFLTKFKGSKGDLGIKGSWKGLGGFKGWLDAKGEISIETRGKQGQNDETSTTVGIRGDCGSSARSCSGLSN